MADRTSAAASGVSYITSAIMSFFGAMTANELAAYTGIVLGVATFAVNWYYRHRHLQLARRALEERKESGVGGPPE